ncbi:hypothetical protein HMPREF0673_02696 [Leyella stercorea DSM 18206]|uniref:Uncharacterized protein n=1 Tax=Leyella stercorea DSM 18206 TaxID=1002367 RepID=G6B1C5_9BACT|nr:hypothetical protein HMPREF0673_02696 [Leyella stercorea DSM 18206]
MPRFFYTFAYRRMHVGGYGIPAVAIANSCNNFISVAKGYGKN